MRGTRREWPFGPRSLVTARNDAFPVKSEEPAHGRPILAGTAKLPSVHVGSTGFALSPDCATSAIRSKADEALTSSSSIPAYVNTRSPMSYC